MKYPLTRRDILRLTGAGTSSLLLGPLAGCGDADSGAGAGAAAASRLDFATAGSGEGWGPGWRSLGVANLRRENGEGLLEAGSDIFPNDPRPVAFARDRRFRDGGIRAVVTRAGRGVGVVLRRRSLKAYYAGIYDADLQSLSIVRRVGFELDRLATTIVPPTARPQADRPAVLELSATGSEPTELRAQLSDTDGLSYATSVVDSTAELQQAGEAGVLAWADTLFPDAQNEAPAPILLPALGNLRLLPFGTEQGMAFLETPPGQAVLALIRERSTAGFAAIELLPDTEAAPTPPGVVAATTGAPIVGGATLHVATDAPAEVFIEVADTPDFTDARVVFAGTTDPDFLAVSADIDELPPGPVWWRPRLRRGAQETVGDPRSFRALPAPGAMGRYTLAYASCAARFGPIFDQLAARQPDVFIWQGDLNYPDTNGPLAQTVPGYAGFWRHFLDNPRLKPLLDNACFVAGRDDHDYGVQDAHAATLVPWGLAPWDALMNPRPFQRISAGPADIWILDQRLGKSDPDEPDTIDKTLLGVEQRRWLFDGLATSTAPFQIICSPTTVAPSGVANEQDGSWAAGFTAERELLLAHIREQVTGRTLFLSGDTHFTMVWERDGLFEQRACPLDIPRPNDKDLANPDLELTFGSTPGVVYWSRRSHFSVLRIGADETGPVLDLELVRDDGVIVHRRHFTA